MHKHAFGIWCHGMCGGGIAEGDVIRYQDLDGDHSAKMMLTTNGQARLHHIGAL